MENTDLPRSYHEFFTDLSESNYLFGLSWHGTPTIASQSPVRDTIFLAVFSDDANLLELRSEVSSFVQSHPSISQVFLLPQKGAARHFLLSPELAQRIYKYGWFSDDGWLDTMTAAGLQRDESIWLAQTLLQTSAELLSNNLTNPTFNRLESIQSKKIQTVKNARDIFACLLDQAVYLDGNDPIQSSQPPIPFVEPIAIYRRLNDLILVTNNPIGTLTQLEINRHQDFLNEHAIQDVQVCTADQFRVIISSIGMLDAKLRRFQHLWGANLLESLTYDEQTMILNAAASASAAEFFEIGQTLYLTPPDPIEDRELIHDLQNRLLNIRLQNEILSGLQLFQKANPTLELPDKTLPINKRLHIIKELFSWWSNFYFSQVRLR